VAQIILVIHAWDAEGIIGVARRGNRNSLAKCFMMYVESYGIILAPPFKKVKQLKYINYLWRNPSE